MSPQFLEIPRSSNKSKINNTKTHIATYIIDLFRRYKFLYRSSTTYYKAKSFNTNNHLNDCKESSVSMSHVAESILQVTSRHLSLASHTCCIPVPLE